MDFFINDTQVYPDNARNFTVNFQADTTTEGTTISESFVEFSKVEGSEGFNLINEAQILGNYAVGLPFKIIDSGVTYFDGFLDLSSVENQFSCDFKSVKLIEKDQNTLKILEALSFDYLAFRGIITKEDYNIIPIKLEYIPDAQSAVIQALTLYQIGKEINEQVREGINPSNIPYLVLHIPLLVNLISSFIKNTYPSERYYYGMTYRKAFEKIAEYMGLTFESSVLDENYAFMPAKDKIPVSNIDNALDVGYENISALEFIRRAEKLFYARLKIQDGIMRFERIDYYWNNNSGIVLPDLLPEQSAFATNLDELAPYRLLEFARDPNDNFTQNDTVGYVCQATVELPNLGSDSLTVEGFENIQLDYTRGHRKDSLSVLEIALGSILNPLINGLEGLASLAGISINIPQIPTKLGGLKISDQRTGVPKFLILDTPNSNGISYLSVDNDVKTKAITLYNKFHYIGSIINNQWRILPELQISIDNINDVIALKGNNYALTAGGDIALIEGNERNDDCMHTITYRVQKNYLPSNLVEVVRER